MATFINAKKDDVSDVVIFLEDSLDVKYLSEKLLKNPVLINNKGLLLGYTGYYNNKKLSVFADGIGFGSISSITYELLNEYGVKKIIRVGKCRSYHDEILSGDLIVVEKSFTTSNIAYEIDGGSDDICKSSVLLSQKLVNTAHQMDKEIRIGTVHSTDIYYNKNNFSLEKAKENYCLVSDMECFPLFYITKMFDKQAAAILTVVDLNSKENVLEEAFILALESITKPM